MSDAQWFPLNTTDWLKGTAPLSAAERGVYITLIALIYDAEGPIKMDRSRLARQCGIAPAAFKKAFESLVECQKITLLDDDHFTNERAEKELLERRARFSKAQAAGKKSQEKQRKRRTNPSPKLGTITNTYTPLTPQGGLVEKLKEKGVCLEGSTRPASQTHQAEKADTAWWLELRKTIQADHPNKRDLWAPIRVTKGKRLIVSNTFDLLPVLEAFGPALAEARAFSVLAEDGEEFVFTQVGQGRAA